jgi:hypothetical protein
VLKVGDMVTCGRRFLRWGGAVMKLDYFHGIGGTPAAPLSVGWLVGRLYIEQQIEVHWQTQEDVYCRFVSTFYESLCKHVPIKTVGQQHTSTHLRASIHFHILSSLISFLLKQSLKLRVQHIRYGVTASTNASSQWKW